MLTEEEKTDLVRRIYQIDGMNGAIIGYYGDQTCSVLSPGYATTLAYSEVMLIIEAVPIDRAHVEPERVPNQPVKQDRLPTYVSNDSKITAELVGAGFNCGIAVISGAGVLGGAAATPASGGASLVVTVALWTGFVTSSIQCVNGIVRVAAAVSEPEGDTLARWDANPVYQNTMLAVDGIGLVAGLAALPQGVRTVLQALERRAGVRGLAVAVARATSRNERKQLIREAFEVVTRSPEAASEIQQALRAAGFTGQQSRNVVNYGVGTHRAARMASTALSEAAGLELARTLRALSSQVGQLAASATMSGMPQSVVGSASGSVRASADLIPGLVVHCVPRN